MENTPDTWGSLTREKAKEEIENFDVKAFDFSFSTGFLFLKKKKCVDVRGVLEEGAKRKGFYYKTL